MWKIDHGVQERQTLLVNPKLSWEKGNLLSNENPERVGEPTHGKARDVAGSR